MKATVLESADGRSVILAEDGIFYTIEGSYVTGDTIEYDAGNSESRTYTMRRVAMIRRIAAVAACFVLLLSGAAYSYQNLMVYADVTLDSEMPVRCSLNRKGEIIKIEALDGSAEELAVSMKEEGIRGKTIEEALEYVEEYIEKNTEDAEAAHLEISVECSDKDTAQKMSGDLNKKYKSDTAKKEAQQEDRQNDNDKEPANGSDNEPGQQGSSDNGSQNRDGDQGAGGSGSQAFEKSPGGGEDQPKGEGNDNGLNNDRP